MPSLPLLQNFKVPGLFKLIDSLTEFLPLFQIEGLD